MKRGAGKFSGGAQFRGKDGVKVQACKSCAKMVGSVRALRAERKALQRDIVDRDDRIDRYHVAFQAADASLREARSDAEASKRRVVEEVEKRELAEAKHRESLRTAQDLSAVADVERDARRSAELAAASDSRRAAEATDETAKMKQELASALNDHRRATEEAAAATTRAQREASAREATLADAHARHVEALQATIESVRREASDVATRARAESERCAATERRRREETEAVAAALEAERETSRALRAELETSREELETSRRSLEASREAAAEEQSALADAAKNPAVVQLACMRCKTWAEAMRNRAEDAEARVQVMMRKVASAEAQVQDMMQKAVSQTLRLCVVAPSVKLRVPDVFFGGVEDGNGSGSGALPRENPTTDEDKKSDCVQVTSNPLDALKRVLEEDVLPKFQRLFAKESGSEGGEEELEMLQGKLWTDDHSSRLAAAIQEQVTLAVAEAA